jgi:hypothetical protein
MLPSSSEGMLPRLKPPSLLLPKATRLVQKEVRKVEHGLRLVHDLDHRVEIRHHAHQIEAEVQEAINARRVVTQVKDEEARMELRFREQGRNSLNTTENIMERLELRDHPSICAELTALWGDALRECQNRLHHVHTTVRGGVTVDSAIDFGCYTELISRVQAVLLGDGIDMTAIADDWQHDAKGSDRMDELTFGDALFELADVWVPAIDAEAYAEFLRRLRRSISFGEYCDHWRPVKACRYDAYIGVPTIRARPHPPPWHRI